MHIYDVFRGYGLIMLPAVGPLPWDSLVLGNVSFCGLNEVMDTLHQKRSAASLFPTLPSFIHSHAFNSIVYYYVQQHTSEHQAFRSTGGWVGMYVSALCNREREIVLGRMFRASYEETL